MDLQYLFSFLIMIPFLIILKLGINARSAHLKPLSYGKNKKIFLDDERDTPLGYIRTHTVEETIELLKAEDVDTLSLDNDLGTGLKEGYQVMDWLEDQVRNYGLRPPIHMMFHTHNTIRKQYMKEVARNILVHMHDHQEQWKDKDRVVAKRMAAVDSLANINAPIGTPAEMKAESTALKEEKKE